MIPDKSDPIWAAIITGSLKVDLEFLGLRILLSRLQRRASLDSSELGLCIEELRKFFEKNHMLPKAQRDFKKIFNRELRP